MSYLTIDHIPAIVEGMLAGLAERLGFASIDELARKFQSLQSRVTELERELAYLRTKKAAEERMEQSGFKEAVAEIQGEQPQTAIAEPQAEPQPQSQRTPAKGQVKAEPRDAKPIQEEDPLSALREFDQPEEEES